MDPAAQSVRALMDAERDHPGAVGSVAVLHRLCSAAMKALEVSGAGVSVMTDQGVRVLAAAEGTSSQCVVELQFSLGEGPCNDAFTTRRPILEGNLSLASSRWPAYTIAAHDYGVRAVFAFPLQVGAARLGVLDLYREQTGQLSADELSHALSFAEVATTVLLDGQQHAPDGLMVHGLDDAVGYHSEVHQAQGMVMVQVGSTLAEALALLRAHAYAQERSLADVAGDVVLRRLRLDEDM
jgi:GAF domain-containing protein